MRRNSAPKLLKIIASWQEAGWRSLGRCSAKMRFWKLRSNGHISRGYEQKPRLPHQHIPPRAGPLRLPWCRSRWREPRTLCLSTARPSEPPSQLAAVPSSGVLQTRRVTHLPKSFRRKAKEGGTFLPNFLHPHPAPCTLHPTSLTIRPTPLNPAPYIQNPKHKTQYPTP
jgi:hypothetical protein